LTTLSGIIKLCTQSVVFSLLAPVCYGQCTPPSESVQAHIAKYAALRFHVDPNIVKVSAVTKVQDSCFWEIKLTADSQRVLVLYLDRDFRYASPDLYDLDADPLVLERAESHRVQEQLLSGTYALKGSKLASTTVVIFTDLQCPYCRSLDSNIKALTNFPNAQPIQVIVRHYPLPMHNWARTAALIGECVLRYNTDLFWGYQDYVFSNQSLLEPENIVELSEKFLTAHSTFKQSVSTCLSDVAVAGDVDKDMRLGRALGVEATPTFFVNGNVYRGNRTLSELQAIVTNAQQNELLRSGVNVAR
jgi:protein-disulfide isomerase